MSNLCKIREILGLDDECYLAEVVITPKMARELLKFNTKNRARHKGRENEYIADMKEGKFTVQESMVGFDSEGVLTNGQGRLHSCVESSIEFLTVVYLRLEQNIHMDTGRTRKTVDNIQLAGALRGICNDNANTIKTVKGLLRVSQCAARVRDEEVINFCKAHAKIIDKAYEMGLLNLSGGKKAVFKLEIAAALLAAAINNVDMNDLVYIRNMLTEGMSVDARDKIILNYREKAFELYGNNSGSARKQIYFGAQHMIYVYTNNLKTKSVKIDSEYYPIF